MIETPVLSFSTCDAPGISSLPRPEWGTLYTLRYLDGLFSTTTRCDKYMYVLVQIVRLVSITYNMVPV